MKLGGGPFLESTTRVARFAFEYARLLYGLPLFGSTRAGQMLVPFDGRTGCFANMDDRACRGAPPPAVDMSTQIY